MKNSFKLQNIKKFEQSEEYPGMKFDEQKITLLIGIKKNSEDIEKVRALAEKRGGC